jgi:hypothetical protein
MIRAVACAAVAAALVAPTVPAGQPAAQEEPRCFGAAARDPRRPCDNARLRQVVTPTPREARRGQNAPCEPVERFGQVGVCWFGAPAEEASTSVALVGDSHAAHWRAALAPAASARGWHGVSLTQTGCPLTRATKILRKPLMAECLRWNAEVPGWLAAHPEIRTVIVSQIVSRVGVVPRAGRSKFETAVEGYMEAWRALPPSVERVVVIRDNPKAAHGVLGCVERAMAERGNAARSCATPRTVALERDPAFQAARRMRSARVRAVDMSDFFCGPRRCAPVIGGVLVYKDRHHITQLYSHTLSPFLGRRIDAVLRGRQALRGPAAGAP